MRLFEMMEIEIRNEKPVLGNFGNDLETEVKNKFSNQFSVRREIMKLPPSAKFILYLIKLRGPLNRKRIIEETLMPDRTVGFALKMLMDKNFIHKVNVGNVQRPATQGRRRRRRKDRRITNYDLVSGLLPIIMAEA